MARQDKLRFIGTEGNVIFYERLGNFFMRSKPKQVNQSKYSKHRAGQFGNASKLARQCRMLLRELIPNPKDKAMQNRLNAFIYEWIISGAGQPLSEFNFLPGKGFFSLV